IGRIERACAPRIQDRVVSRRQARHVDGSLPHPRAPRGRNDGALRGRSVNQARSVVIDHSTFDRTSLRLSATLMLVGQILYILVTLLHTGGEANNHPAIFAAYAARDI